MSASMQWIIKGDDLKIRDISTPDRVMVHVDWREGMERHSWVVSGDAAHVVAMLDEIREPFAAELRCTEADYDAAEARYEARVPDVNQSVWLGDKLMEALIGLGYIDPRVELDLADGCLHASWAVKPGIDRVEP